MVVRWRFPRRAARLVQGRRPWTPPAHRTPPRRAVDGAVVVARSASITLARTRFGRRRSLGHVPLSSSRDVGRAPGGVFHDDPRGLLWGGELACHVLRDGSQVRRHFQSNSPFRALSMNAFIYFDGTFWIRPLSVSMSGGKKNKSIARAVEGGGMSNMSLISPPSTPLALCDTPFFRERNNRALLCALSCVGRATRALAEGEKKCQK